MAASVLKAPAATFDASEHADWLELTALFDDYGLARLDTIVGALIVQEEEEEEDIAAADAAEEALRASIESELAFREKALGRQYPFALSEDGETLAFKEPGARSGAMFYLLCLVLSHATDTRILRHPPKGQLLARARNVLFQALATFATAGVQHGPAVWLGWPRPTDESILQVVARACQLAGTGSARLVPGPHASTYDKDGGIDVLSWTSLNDAPPPAYFSFTQTASGHNWEHKSARLDSERLLHGYFQDFPNCQLVHLTICPFRLDPSKRDRHHREHGMILDRTRAPYYAWLGYQYHSQGAAVDNPDGVQQIWRWLRRYVTSPTEGDYVAA